VRRLDGVFAAWVEGIPSPRLYLKPDTQSFDIEVVRGAVSVLDNDRALRAEVCLRPISGGMPACTASIRQFRDSGVDVVDFIPASYDADHLRVVETDCVMVHRP
jgi:hypothetical protein